MVTTTSQNEAEHENLYDLFRERAKALRDQPEIYRSTLMTGLIAESIGWGVPAEAEYFTVAYGDPAGRDYWTSHLSEPMRVGALAYLLSAHLPLKPEQLEFARIAITVALRDAAAAGERLFVGDVAPLLAFDGPEYDFSGLIKVKVRSRAAVDWLLGKPKREYLVPDSLRRFMEGRSAGSTKLRRLSMKGNNDFVAEFINNAKKAGKRPSLEGLEAAHKAAGFHGGRRHLRDAFRRNPDVEVKEGRPPKLAK